MTDTDDVLEQARDWLASGKKIAIATVIRTWGSSPRPVGSQLAVGEDGAFVGSVSGGCIEGAVVGEALAAIEDGKPRTLEFGVSDEQAWEVGLACGGEVNVYVARETDGDALQRMIDGRPVAAAIQLETGARSLIGADGVSGPLALDDAALNAARAALRDDVSRTVETGAGDLFIRAFNPPLRMFVVGAVHISQALLPMAAAAGFDVTVIDPRGAFATAARFPDTQLTEEWPDEALDRLKPDSRTAVVTLTHDPKLDDPALDRALRSDAFYIGALGSTRTHAKRLARLTELGFTETDFARIHGPVGLDLGAASPAEIAVSILAQVIAVKHGKAFAR